MKYHYTVFRMAKIPNTKTISTGQAVDKWELSFIAAGNAKTVLGNSLAAPYKAKQNLTI